MNKNKNKKLIILKQQRINNRQRRYKRTKNYKDQLNVVLANNIKTMEFSSGTNAYRYEVQGNLWTAHHFDSFCDIFQQYKLNKITVDVMPQQVQGSDPPSGYVYMYVNEDEYDTGTTNYIPTYPSSKVVSNKHKSSFTFRVPGRQNDFNYWYNTLSTGSQISAYICFRFHTSMVPGMYMVRIRYYLSFRYRTYETPSAKIFEDVKEVIDDGGIPKPIVREGVIKNLGLNHIESAEKEKVEFIESSKDLVD